VSAPAKRGTIVKRGKRRVDSKDRRREMTRNLRNDSCHVPPFGSSVYRCSAVFVSPRRSCCANASSRQRVAAVLCLSDEADGLAEAAYLLSRLGFRPVAVTRPIQDTRQRGLLILVEPQQAGVLGDESDALAEAERSRSFAGWTRAIRCS